MTDTNRPGKTFSLAGAYSDATPLIRIPDAGFWIKYEGFPVPGTFKLRIANEMAREGVAARHSQLTVSGDADLALAASYVAAKAGLNCRVWLRPQDAARVGAECALYGAEVSVQRQPSTVIEPRWLVGLQQIAREIVEQLGREPELVLCPDDELLPASLRAELSSARVTTVRMHSGADPGGEHVSVSNEDAVAETLRLWRAGVPVGIETAACVCAARGCVASSDVVIIERSSGMRDLPLLARKFSPRFTTEYDKLGGLITPR